MDKDIRRSISATIDGSIEMMCSQSPHEFTRPEVEKLKEITRDLVLTLCPAEVLVIEASLNTVLRQQTIARELKRTGHKSIKGVVKTIRDRMDSGQERMKDKEKKKKRPMTWIPKDS